MRAGTAALWAKRIVISRLIMPRATVRGAVAALWHGLCSYDRRTPFRRAEPSGSAAVKSVMVCILVDSPDSHVSAALRHCPSLHRFRIVDARAHANFIELVRRERPAITIIDRINECQDAALLKIAIVKDHCPDTRIVAVSACPSTADAAVVEQGVFYYLTDPVGNELIRIIEAAVRTLAPESQGLRDV